MEEAVRRVREGRTASRERLSHEVQRRIREAEERRQEEILRKQRAAKAAAERKLYFEGAEGEKPVLLVGDA